jgi:phosphatidylserine/phosphatidylglycerophosphate/cardiolipin synthase-like enzyme
VPVRLVTDDVTALSDGSLVFKLAEAGIATVVDSDFQIWKQGPGSAPPRLAGTVPRHMHHKFALVDGRVLLTGSYNYTQSAAAVNHENIVVTDDAYHVAKFTEAFDNLWREFRKSMFISRQEAAVRIQRIERGRRERSATATAARAILNGVRLGSVRR